MSQPAFLAHPTIVRLPKLLEEVAHGELRIPRFTRDFVWPEESRLLLFKSIYQGIPIGSILVWRTREHELKSVARLGDSNIVASPGSKVGSVNQYVLAGLQRLFTLYTTLGPGLPVVQEIKKEYRGTEPPTEWVEIGEVLRPIYFDLERMEFELEPRGVAIPPTWLPLSILLDPYALFDFLKGISDLPSGRQLINRAESLSNTFKDYSIAIVPIVTEDLDLVAESFQRINSAGQSMDLVNMVNALLWSPDFDINDRIEGIKSELAEVGWGDLEDMMILDVCKAGLDLDLYGTDAAEIKEALLESEHIIDDAAGPLKAMADFLARRCGIFGPSVLPYRYQAVLLAEALRVAGSEVPLPEKTETALVKWFWLTTYGEYFAGINYSRLRKAVEHLRGVVERGDSPEPPDLGIEVRPWPRFDFRNARSRAILLRMAEFDPRGPDGESQGPFRLLAEQGRNAAPMLIMSREVGNRKVAEGPENRIIADPRNIGPLRRLLRSGEADPGILRSHGIDGEMAKALRAGDVNGFLILRHNYLAATEARFVEEIGMEYRS